MTGRKMGVVLSRETCQMYQLTRYVMEPDYLTSSVKDYRWATKFDEYDSTELFRWKTWSEIKMSVLDLYMKLD